MLRVGRDWFEGENIDYGFGYANYRSKDMQRWVWAVDEQVGLLLFGLLLQFMHLLFCPFQRYYPRRHLGRGGELARERKVQPVDWKGERSLSENKEVGKEGQQR